MTNYSRVLSNNFSTNVLHWPRNCEISFLLNVEEPFCLHKGMFDLNV